MLARFDILIASAAVVACLSTPALATAPTKDEITQCKSWVNAHFQRIKSIASATQAQNKQTGLMVIQNNGPILKDGRPDGRPIKIGDTEYKRGLICHAVSNVKVTLPSPAKSFSATVGVDANAGGGSVIFTVRAGNKDLYTSEVMKGSQAGVPVSVDLNGATEFVIKASDAGDGINCDHADWADAKVTLMDGKELWLSDMPEVGSAYTVRGLSTPPFSFVYDGKCSDELIGNWKYSESTKKLDKNRIQKTQTYLDPKTNLEMRVEMVQYNDYPTLEWTIYFANKGDKDTPILENIQAIDTMLARKSDNEFILHHFKGAGATPYDYEPLAEEMAPNAHIKITGEIGWPTSTDLSYFNIETNRNEGIILALGWSGQWAGDFIRDDVQKMRVICGQELTYLKLHPGEKIRTPMVVMQFWQGGDWIRAQNIWRKWMITHNMPHPGGKPVAPQYGGCNGNMIPFAAEEIAQIDAYYADGVTMDYWVIDAGWYPSKDNWWNTGTWEVDKTRFPKGLREVADRLHEKGAEFIVWFEPERCVGDSWIAKNHPEWILTNGLVNLGIPDARKWLNERVESIMTSEGIDQYRGDYNIGALPSWRNNDTADRQGITENLYVQGFRDFWDEILRKDPKRYIDSCAGGGRRNDVETMRRAVPLLRSDYWAANRDGAIGSQGQTYGISMWMPYYGTGAGCCDIYTLRSAYCPSYRIGYNALDPNRKADLFRQAVKEIKLLKPYWLGDYYPLTPYNRSTSEWIAWQFDSPEKGGGFVQAFRREENNDSSMTFKLRGLLPSADYIVTNLDDNKTQKISGRTLIEKGLEVTISDKPGSAVLIYKKAK